VDDLIKEPSTKQARHSTTAYCRARAHRCSEWIAKDGSVFASLFISAALCVGQAQPVPKATLGQPQESSSTNDETPPEDKRGFLMKALGHTDIGAFLNAHKITASGWTDMSFTASNLSGPILPLGFNWRGNEFLLQQNWLRIEQAVDKDAKTATFGFRSDTILPGSDYRFTLPRGIWNSQLTARNGEPAIYGIDPIQFYAEGYFPSIAKGLDVKVGRIFCQYGVESNDAPGNALFSHAYTFIYDPFTHTGAMGTLQLTDSWSVQGGLMLGNDVFINAASNLTGMGNLKWASTNGNDSVLASFIVGSARFDQTHNFHNPDIFDLIVMHKFNSKLTYNFEALYGFTTNVPDIGFANWFGIINYLTYDFSSKMSGTTRLEFFDDVQGQRTGFKGLYTAITGGLTFKPHRAIIIRPEIRYDFNDESRPYQGQRGLFTASSDIIVRW
jgi:hypothetical protein